MWYKITPSSPRREFAKHYGMVTRPPAGAFVRFNQLRIVDGNGNKYRHIGLGESPPCTAKTPTFIRAQDLEVSLP